RNAHVPRSGAVPATQLHMYPLRDHPVGSEHGYGGARMEGCNRINKLHYEGIGCVHALSNVSVSGRLEDGSACNLLRKFKKREALESAGHEAERMIVIEPAERRQR